MQIGKIKSNFAIERYNNRGINATRV